MEDFEYSVEICDRDWDCFFAECEECNLFPPSLAGVDDSGMSDIDDTGSILAKRVQKVELTAGFSEAELPIDGPPDCEGSPVEHYLSKHTVLGMESMLSGSEEDIHLQSVNMFIEKLKNVTEADSLTEPSRRKDGKNSEAMQEDERCSDGQQASGISLPKNIPKLNTLPASGETAVGKETTEPVDTISNIMKKDVLGFNISLEPAASNVVFKTNKSAYPETRLFIREETCTETRVNEATQLNHSNDSLEGVVSSETTPQTEKVIPEEMRSPLENIEQEDLSTSQLTLSKICSMDLSSNLEMGTHVERNPNPDVLQSDAAHRNKAANQESSPSASIKRKRRKKRRLSVEPTESVHGYERKLLVKQSDSEEEEEEYVFRGRTSLCLSADIHLSDINDLPNNDISSVSAYTATSNLPVKISAKDISQHQYLLESIVRKGRSKPADSTESDANNNRSTNSWNQTDDSSMSASNNSGNLATNLQLCSKLRVEESTRVIDAMTGKSESDTETANRGGKDTHAESLQQLDNVSQSIICCENERNPESYSTKVKSICILPSAESNDPAVEASQSDKLSAAKLVLAVEAGNSGRDTHTVCQREAEPQQQLEIDCQDIDQYRSRLEKPHFPLPASSSDSHDTKCNQLKTGVSALLEEISNPVGCAKLALDTRTVLPERDCVATSPCRLDINSTAQQTEHHLVLQTSKLNVLSEKSITNERTEFASSQIMAFQSESSFLCGENNLMGKSQRGNKSSLSEDLLTSPSDITPVLSYCSLDTESVESLSNENIAGNQSNCDNQGEKTWLILAKHEEGGDTSVSNDTTDSKCDSVIYAEDIITASKTEFEPEKEMDAKCSVFAMSSFWSDMEKLTINDILGLRMISKAAPLTSHPPLQENEQAGTFAMTDSGFFNQLDESKSEQTNEDMASDPNSVESSSDSVQAVDASTLRGVIWEGLGADNYHGNMTLTSVSDISQSVLSGAAETHLRKISKNVSMHNLLSLECESSRYTREGQTLRSLDEGEEEYFTDEDKDVDSIAPYSPDSYRISLTDIFEYLFSGKQSIPSQSATDSKIACCNDGNSVSEMYDHFFSEYDTESFFYPLVTAEDETKDELVPIFSCPRSSNRNLQFPEAYDHFFVSSSSDDSSVESDEEDGCGPVRVVTRLSHASSASEISTDTYENFFTDSDLRQNFFWKTTFSFRNFSLSGSAGQRRTLSNPLPVSVSVRQSGSSSGRTVHPVNPRDMTFPDPLLGLQSLGYKDLQTPLPNPRTDASLLPLRQSDMCLVCIAFASWVLKTANPQVGDTWKAVLLANVSALSAIRYLRKYVKMEVATNQKKMNYTTPSES